MPSVLLCISHILLRSDWSELLFFQSERHPEHGSWLSQPRADRMFPSPSGSPHKICLQLTHQHNKLQDQSLKHASVLSVEDLSLTPYYIQYNFLLLQLLFYILFSHHKHNLLLKQQLNPRLKPEITSPTPNFLVSSLYFNVQPLLTCLGFSGKIRLIFNMFAWIVV